MKWILPFLLSTALSSKEQSVGTEDELRWMLLPDDNGNVQVAILSGVEPRSLGEASSVQFLLWTRKNPVIAERQVMNGTCWPYFNYFHPQVPTKILVHGFGDNAAESFMFRVLKDAFLSRGDFNVIAVDWSELAATPWYNSASDNTRTVAQHTANFIDFMVEKNSARIDDFHLIGFSLGAHVVGVTGQYVRSGRIRRVTGLDPAQVLFTGKPDDKRLDSSDADLVEIVHTSGGYLGYMSSLGHRDFFPNGGGWPQPGCRMDFIAVCSHRRAYYYYAEAIQRGKGFLSSTCDTWEKENDSCKQNINVELWNEIDNSTTGNFFLETNPEEPFGKYSDNNKRSIWEMITSF